MNNQDKLQKFSIRKYAVGTFSTVIATLVFIGFNPGQAHANEVSQNQKVIKQQEASHNDEDNLMSKSQFINESQNLKNQVGNTNSLDESNQKALADKSTLSNNVDSHNVRENLEQEQEQNQDQASTYSNGNNISNQSSYSKEDLEINNEIINTKKQEDKEEQDQESSKKEDNKVFKKPLAEKRANKDEKNKESLKEKDKNSQVQPPIDRNKLQTLFDASYHDYRMIDKDKANPTEFNKVKAIFDKVNEFLGNNEDVKSEQFVLLYQELEQALQLAHNLPKHTNAKVKPTRTSRSANQGRTSDYTNANTEYYVSRDDDGSSYPVGTFLHASNKGAPYKLPTTPYNMLKASSVKNIAYITHKRLKDGYKWDILFNLGHSNHENMIYWFSLPRDQTPTGPVTFTVINKNGTSTSHGGYGSGSAAPLPQMWETLNFKVPIVAKEFKHGDAHNHTFYEMPPDVYVRSFFDFARGSEENAQRSYFNRNGASHDARRHGDENYAYLNGDTPQEGQGLDSIYSFIGSGDASYRISFKTSGAVTNRLYYAAGGRAREFRQLFNFNQLTVEPKADYLKRVASLSEVKSRTLHLGNSETYYDSNAHRNVTRLVLDGDGSGVKEYVDDPLSYVKNISNSVMGFFTPNAPYNQERWQGLNPLNDYQISDLFTNDKLQKAARSGKPIRLMIGFDAEDSHHNPETLVPVNLFVKPQLRQNIELYHDNEGRNRKEFTISNQAGHAVFQVMSGTLHNVTNPGSNQPYQQEVRIKLTSNEPIKDKDWTITGYPHTLAIQNAVGRTNNAYEKNLVLTGQIGPGNYFVTVRLGDKVEQFEIRSKPNPPQILTTATELRGNPNHRPEIRVTNIPNDSTARIRLVIDGTDGSNDTEMNPYTVPENYTVIAETSFDNDPSNNGIVTFQSGDYLRDLPYSGELKAITYYNDNVQSNFSNIVEFTSDTTPPTINEPAGLVHKYYRGDHVEITLPVTDNDGGSGLRSVDVNLPPGWNKEVYINPNNHNEGTVKLIGNIPTDQSYNTTYRFTIRATDMAGNVTNPTKNFILNVGKLSDDQAPINLSNKKLVVNPSALTVTEKDNIQRALRDANTALLRHLSQTNPIVVGSNGDVTFNYRDGSSDVISAENNITYEPEKKSNYSENGNNNKKEAVITIAKGQNYDIGRDVRKYFSLSNGADIPTTSFTNITPINTLPTSSDISRLNVGTYTYRLNASNAYNKVSQELTLKLKVVDVNAPDGDNRVYRVSTYDISSDEINNIKQAFKAANPNLNLNDDNIIVTNTFEYHRVNNVNVSIRKGELVKDFTSNLNNMNFMRWINLRDDYDISWSSNKISGRNTDSGLEWSPDHKSIIYKYDATLGRMINTNDILSLLRATAKNNKIRTNLTGEEKQLAERRMNGYSQTDIRDDGQRSYLFNSKPIQVLDIVDPANGFGGREVNHSNIAYNERNSSIVDGQVPSANNAAAFDVNKVVKANGSDNGVMGVIYKAQLYLTPYNAKTYIEKLGQSSSSTDNVINIYFIPSDKVNPNLSVGNYSNNVVYSGETFKNTINVSDDYGLNTVATTTDSTISMTRNNNELSGVAPNTTNTVVKSIKIKATDKSNNETTTSFNVTIKPLNTKYRVSTSATNQAPVRISNIQNNATLSTEDQNKVKATVQIVKVSSTRNYVIERDSDVRSQTVSNVTRRGNDASVNVVTTYIDGTTTQITVPVKHIIQEVIASPKTTVKGQQFPAGKGTSPNDFFSLSNGSPVDARIVWVNNQGPNINSNQIGTDITLHAEIYFDGETTPIRKDTTYRLSQSMPKQIYETTIKGSFNSEGDTFAGNYVQPINRYWPEHMNFNWAPGSSAPSSRNVGSFTQTVTVQYENGQSENVNVLFKVKPNKPVIDANSVIAKGGLTGQQIIVRNVPSNAQVTLYQSDGSIIPNTNSNISQDGTAIVTIQGSLPVGNITAKTYVTNNVTYSKLNTEGTVSSSTENVSVYSDSSDQAQVTTAMQVKNGGIKFIKGTTFDFNNYNSFISNIPTNSQLSWQENPDSWKNTLGESTKRVNVVLPNNQGERSIDIPVLVYPPATAKAPDRDKKGQNLTKGTDAINYLNFEGNNRYGASASWKDGREPNNNLAGVQNLVAVVNYPGIPTAVEVPVKVWVYNFIFKQPQFETELGQTMSLGTNAGNYYKLENGDGLPLDGFKFYWTNKNDANWYALQEASQIFSVNQSFDVVIPSQSWNTWQLSEPAKFVVKNIRPNTPSINQNNNNGNVTITPGANKSIRVLSGQKDTSADKLIVNRNDREYFVITKNNEGKWQLNNNQQAINGVNFDVNTGAITFNYDVLTPGDTLKAIATQGSGDTISSPAETNNFIVKVPQPERANGKTWQNGTFEITPDNATNTTNPTEFVDIAYTEKVDKGNEISKSITITKGNNGRWTITDKPSYVTLNESNGKILFNANSIKPNSRVTITSRAGTGVSENSINNEVQAPSRHEITNNVIVKEQGDNLTNEDVNNAIVADNKRNAVIKNGTSLPNNLAGGSTTQIPVIINYNDNSIEEVTETIRTKVNKDELIASRNHLNDEISKENKTPSSIQNFDQAIERARTQIENAKNEADRVINKEFATPEEVNHALSKVREAQNQIDEAQRLLQNKVDNSELVAAKERLESALEPPASTEGMTESSKQEYNTKRQNAEHVIQDATTVINNGDASVQNVRDAKNRVEQALREYNAAKSNLRADKTQLEEAYNQLNQPVQLDDKKPSTVNAYTQAIENIKSQLEQAKNDAQTILHAENPSVTSVSEALRKVQEVQPKVTQAINLLEQKADNSQLIAARDQLQNTINPELPTTGMTQESAQNYHQKLQEAKTTIQNANDLINNGDATVEQINEEIGKVNQAKVALNQAKQQLTADTTQLQHEVQQLDRRGETNQKKPNSIQSYQNALHAIEDQIHNAQATARTIINKPIRTIEEVNNSLQELQQLNQQLTSAIEQLQPLADNSGLIASRNKLEEKVNANISTDGMTAQSIESYNNAKNAAKTEIQVANGVINDGNVSDNDISSEIAKLEAKYNSLNEAINGLTVDRTPLEEAKTALQQSIDIQAELNGKTANSVDNYRQKLEAAKNEITAINQVLAGNPSVNDINTNKANAERIKAELDNARNELKVDKQPLEEAKNALQQVIDQGANTDGMTQESIDNYNESLGEALAERAKLNRIIKGNPTVEEVTTAVREAEQAKQGLLNGRAGLTPDQSPLQNAKNELENSINQPTDTAGMTESSLNNYNEKLNSARQELEKINHIFEGQPTVSDIRQSAKEATAIKNALEAARSQLTLNREPYINHINNESSLNTAQKDKFKEQINLAPNQASLENIKSNADELNQAMSKLVESVADNEATKLSEDYIDASPSIRNNYDNAVNAAKGIISQTVSPTMDSSTIQQKANEVKQAKNNLDGDERLASAKNEALNHLQELNDLNEAQNHALTNQINDSRNITSVNQANDLANSINTSMTSLKQSIADNVELLSKSEYANADPDKQTAYNQAVEHAMQIIQQTEPQNANLNPTEINNATGNVNNTKTDLNGVQRLAEAKEQAKNTIENLQYLNEAQREQAKSNVTDSTTKDDIASQLVKYQTLNTSMKALRDSVANNEDVKRGSDYINEDSEPRETYDQAVSNAQSIINAQSNPQMDADVVNQTAQAVTTAQNNLHGQQKLEEAQHSAITEINNLTHLTTAQKEAENALINSKSTRTEVQSQLEKAKALDNSMGTLIELVNNQTQVQRKSNYINEDQPEQTAYNSAISTGQTIIDKTNNPVLDKNTVDEAINNINTKISELHGEQKLANAKTNAISGINTLADLNTPQRNAIIDAVNASDTRDNVSSEREKANAINNAMHSLRQNIADNENVINQSKYINAETNKKTAYTDAVNAAKAIISEQQTNIRCKYD